MDAVEIPVITDDMLQNEEPNKADMPTMDSIFMPGQEPAPKPKPVQTAKPAPAPAQPQAPVQMGGRPQANVAPQPDAKPAQKSAKPWFMFGKDGQ